MELKYQLYLNKIYFTSNTLFDTLSILNESLSEDSIENRLRLTKRILIEEGSKIDYVEKLPEINNKAGQNILILRKIKDKKSELWQEYLTFLLNNNLYDENLKEINEGILSLLSFAELFSLFRNLNFTERDKDNILFPIQNLILGFFLWLVSKNKVIFHSIEPLADSRISNS
jgi:hypothetical protein